MPAQRDFWHVGLPLLPEVRRPIVETLRNHRAVEVGFPGHLIDPTGIEIAVGTCPDWDQSRDFAIQQLRRVASDQSAFVLRVQGMSLSGSGRDRSIWLDIDGEVDRFHKLEQALKDALSTLSPKLARERLKRDRPGIFLLETANLFADPQPIIEAFAATKFTEFRVNGFLTEHVYTDPVRPEWNFRRRVAFFDFATSMLPNEALLGDPSPERRIAAIPFVIKQGVAAIPILITALADQSLPVRRSILRALGQLGRLNPSARRTVQSVLTRIAQTDASGEMRADADEVLFALQTPSDESDRQSAELLRERFLAASPNELLPLLVDHSKTFSGKPLQRTSWEVVAQAFAALPTRERLLPLLLTAQTRGDLTRLVAAARTALEKRKRGGAGRGFAPQSQIQIHRGAPVSTHDDLPNIWDLQNWEVNYYGDIWDEHRLYVRNHPGGPEHLFDPISPVEECVRNLYNRLVRRSVAPGFSSIEARIAPALLAKLRKQIGGRPVIAPELIDLLERHNLTHTWPDLASQVGLGQEHPTVLSAAPHRVTSAEELAAISWYQEEGFALPPHEVDWEKALASIARRLTSFAASPVEIDHVARACFYTVLTAEPETLRDFALALMTAHSDYAALFRLLLLRAPTIKSLLFGRFEKSAGSALVVNLIACNLQDGLRLTANQLLEYLDPGAPTAEGEPGEARAIRTLLLSGAGTLRRMDYPEFTLCCRPVLSEITSEDEAELNALRGALADVHKTLQNGSDLEIYRTLLGAETLLGSPGTSPAESGLKALHTLTAAHDIHALCESLTPYAAAYVALKTEVFAGETVRIRKKHVRQYLARLAQSSPSLLRGAAESARKPFPPSLVALRANVSLSLFKEALAHAVTDHLHGAFEALTPTLKEHLTGALRLLSLTFEWDDPTRNEPTHPDVTVPSEWVTEPWQRTIFLLTRAMDNSPLALCDALGFSHRDGVPRLRGGARLPIEQRWRKLIRRLTGAFKTTDLTVMRRIKLRPISKIRALGRSSLGSDCSSNAVPFRALSPHHVYYTLFENGQPLQGYVTVYEAWAEHLSTKLPVLCLETVNVPTHALDSALPDLIAVLEAVAEVRGLHRHLVVITDIGTYNHRSMPILQRMRRFRRGNPVELTPADPPLWNVYAATSPDADRYTAFVGNAQSGIRLLAPPETDRPLHPDTLAEITRIKALPRTELVGTTYRNGKMVGFISGLPTVPAI